MSLYTYSSTDNQKLATGKNTVVISDAEIAQQEAASNGFSSALIEEKKQQQYTQLQEANELKKMLLETDESHMNRDIMTLDPTTFDQNAQVGWRKYSEGNMKSFLESDGEDISGFHEAIQVMSDYLANYPFEEGFGGHMDKRGIEFHLGQQYAMIGDYTNALQWFTKLQGEGSKKHGKEYVDATIAFLQRDKRKLESIYATSHSLHDGDKEFIRRLYTHFDKKYSEAYNDGMSLIEQSQYLQ